jgi:hypothetical protein
MSEFKDFDPHSLVHEVIRALLRTALPPELAAATPELAERVEAHPEVAPHASKLWCELNESERNIVAREVGLLARDVVVGAGATSVSGEHLH